MKEYKGTSNALLNKMIAEANAPASPEIQAQEKPAKEAKAEKAPKKEKAETVRADFKLPPEINDYLTDRGYQTRTSRTAYLIKLIREDMEKNAKTSGKQ